MNIQPFRLERYYSQFEFSVPYMLSSSDAETFTIAEVLALEPGAQAKFETLGLGYTQSQGDPVLRAEITRLYQSIQPEQILVHAGAEEAIFNLMNVVLKPGDHAIIHAPCYQSLSEIPVAIGCEVTLWQTTDEKQWELDLDVLSQSIQPNTRLIVVNSPHNPTGYLMSPSQLQAIVDIARKHHLLLFSDEVYRFSEYNPADRLPAACDLYENAVSLGVMSKTFGLAGLRIGWIATQNETLYKQLAAFKDYTSICNSAPSEFLAMLALKHQAHFIQRNTQLMIENHQTLTTFFNTYAHLFSWVAPKAGAIAFPRINFNQTSQAFCQDLMTQKGVLLLPSDVYDYGNQHFRIGFGRQNFKEALSLLEDYLHQAKLV